ncbi:sulfatase-like hydrolase/transferase [Novosphingobium aquae]|uniref:Sulfatase-like hydrolase/transferase n=1 Tax=Novosphingobium aquae TaxID=3133435 RepID=A0ABU8SAH1_9SPHN
MRALVYSIVSSALLSVAACAPAPAPPAQSNATVSDARPNIVLIVADDLGWGDLSSYGGPVTTPNLDQLARDGVRYTQAYASAYQCSPSRAGLMTGRYQERFGHESNFRGPGDGVGGIGLAAGMKAFEEGALGPTGMGTPRGVPMVSERLKEAGYHTAMFGKWHLGFDPGMRPRDRGFDEFFGFLAGSTSYALSNTPDIVSQSRVGNREGEDDEGMGSSLPDQRSPYYALRDGDGIAADQGGYLTDVLSDRAVSFIKRQDARNPFFLYLAHLAPHQPLTALQRNFDRLPQITDRRKRIYYAMILSLDESVGAVRAALREKGLDRNTIVIFTSDNGCPRPGIFCSNGALREGKQSLYEGGLRVPLIASWPGRLADNSIEDGRVSLLDLAPTFLKAAKAGPDRNLDGIFLPQARSADPARALFWRHQVHSAMIEGPWKLIDYASVEGRRVPFLFNLSADQGEKMNKADEDPARVARMRAAMRKWESGLSAPRWVPPNPKRRTYDGVTVDMY